MDIRFDAVVVGAGVVGLACVARLAEYGLQTAPLEKERRIGQGISSRNSEVIDAGVYYKQESLKALKARLAVRCWDALYDYCRRRNVQHRRIGKWIVAQRDHQRAALAEFAERGSRNGVDDLRFVEGDQIRRVEPALNFLRRLGIAVHRYRRQPRPDAVLVRRF